MGVAEQTLMEVALRRQLMALIVSYLKDNNLVQAASVVANATMTPMDVEVPPNKLLELVQKGLAVENHSGSSRTFKSDAGAFLSFSTSSGSSSKRSTAKVFPRFESQSAGEHKNAVRCARFSSDGRYVATGGADTSVKLFEVEKVQQMMSSGGSSSKPTVKTFYDHVHPVNDLDFHPQGTILISGSKDRTIKFFDVAKSSARRAAKYIQDTHNVRSVCFHPCGDFLLAGTDHPIPHLYDVNTFQCYVSTTLQEKHLGSAINQVRYSEDGALYVTASKDGGVRVWDGKTAQCVRAIQGAHVSAEATSAIFTRDQKMVLSCGKDYAIVLWDVGTGKQVKRYIGCQHSQTRCQAVFTHNEEFVLSTDEPKSEIVVWDTQSSDLVTRIPSNHSGTLRWVEHSPIEPCFVTCGSDRAVRFWQLPR